MTARTTRPALLIPCLLLAACTSSEVTYKAISRDIPCDVDPDLTTFVANKKMENLLYGQTRQFLSSQDGASGVEFSNADRVWGATLSYNVVDNFRSEVRESLRARMPPARGTGPVCYLAIEPVKFVTDTQGPFSIELKTTVTDLNSGRPLLANKIRISSRQSAQVHVVDDFADALVRELKKDRFFR